MHRFFVLPEWLHNDHARIEGPTAHQIGRVLRLRPGDRIALLDDSGMEYLVELERISAKEVTARVVAAHRPDTEPPFELTLYQALPKGKKFDWVLQKGTEVGITTFCPMMTRHVVPQGHVPADRLTRWRRIVTEAAEQSGRARLPQVEPVQTFDEICRPAPEGTLALIATPEAGARPLQHVLEKERETPREVRLYVGPEGGFSDEEVMAAREAGIVPVSLGPRILRTETAPLYLAIALLYALERPNQGA
ncbi:MAG TPA: 16S rRNA (uracil(1498)-N(3))-methyltransferase [Chloroflexi bacterium]|jgi:16S rRNA (uracil1498-N3)-methyltransferase|nr:16S rRNA (uracil(1498)-N(3))-methyltransferase [Chloroflexota bacterium]